MSEDIKYCPGCDTNKESCEFHSDRSRKDYLKGYCKECQKNLNKNYRSTKEGFLRSIVLSARNRSKSKGIEFDITNSFLLDLYNDQSGRCAITDERLTFIAGKGQVLTNTSIDRIDSGKGYTKDNVQLVCNIVNIMKYTMSYDELFQWCYKIINGLIPNKSIELVPIKKDSERRNRRNFKYE